VSDFTQAVSRLLLIIIASVMLTSVFTNVCAVNTPPRVIRVPQDFSTIQDAVDVASARDIIIVGPGEYYGAVLDTPNLEIRGFGAVIVDGPLHDSDPNLRIGFFCPNSLSSGATIGGFSFTVDLPIFGRHCEFVTVERNTMIQPLQGVTCVSGSRWSIIHNSIYGIKNVSSYYGAGVAIYSLASSDPSACENLVAFNTITGDFPEFRELPPIGIWLSSQGGGIITRNKIVYNRVTMTGNGPQLFAPAAIVMSCVPPNIQSLFFDNKVGFNDLRGSILEIFYFPWVSAFEDYNDISMNLGTNRAYDGIIPNVFKPVI